MNASELKLRFWVPVGTRVSLRRVLGVLAAFVVFVLAYDALHPRLGAGAGSLYTGVLFVAGILLGFRGGLVMGLVSVPLLALLDLALGFPLTLDAGAAVFYTVLDATVGGAVGWLRDLRETVASEVRERVAAEAALDRERRLHASVLEAQDALGEGVLILDGSRISFANVALGNIFGRRVEANADVATLFSLRPGDSQNDLAQAMQKLMTSEGARSFRSTITREDGSVRPIEGSVQSFSGDGERRLVALVRDVSDRERLESEAQARSRLDAERERLASLGTLVAGVAHEINNPLMYLMGNLELALGDLAEAESEGRAVDLAETSTRMRTALAGAENIAKIVRSLKVVARKDIAVERAPVDLVDVARAVEGLVRVALPDDVTLSLRAPSEPVPVIGSTSELHQVTLNLVKNAIEAATLSRGAVEISVFADAQHAVLDVIDEGPGLAPEALARLFDPFFTTKPHGTGLGLSVARSIVQAHGGAIVAEPRDQGGAHFRVRLPLARRTTSGDRLLPRKVAE